MPSSPALRAVGAGAGAVLAPLRAIVVPELIRYRTDPWAHCDDGHVWILDLETMEPVEFHPYEHQREMAAAWIDLPLLRKSEGDKLLYRNAHEEKSRQMGGTWALSWLELWALMYHSAPGVVIHLNGAEVDDGGEASTVDSFFGKIRFMARHRGDPDGPPEGFPEHLRPDYLYFRSSPESIIRNRLNPRAFLVGEKATPDPARGGRFKKAILDEAARLPWGESVHAALTRAVPAGRYYISTPKGEDNMYFRLLRDRPEGYAFLRQHWSRHPVYSEGAHLAALPDVDPATGRRAKQPAQPSPEMAAAAKGCAQCAATRAGASWRADAPEAHRFPGRLTSPWYERAILDLNDEQVAAELDIDYSRSLAARVYPEFSEEVHVVDRIEPDEKIMPELSWDFGVDTTSVVVFQELPNELHAIAEAEVHDSTPEQDAAAVRAALEDCGLPFLYAEPEWTERMLCVGDPAGEGREKLSGRPLTAEYRRLGFNIASRRQSIAVTIFAVKRLLLGRPKRLVISRESCPLLVEHFKGNVWPTDREGNRRIGATEPLNNRHNHMLRGAAYYAAWKYPPPDDPLGRGRVATAPDERDALAYERLGVDPDTGKLAPVGKRF